MKGNELIGVVGVFILTFCLIALYHLMSKIGSHRRPHGAQIKRAPEQGLDRRLDHQPPGMSGKDDAWLLRSPEPDERADPSEPGFPDLREKKTLGPVRESR